MTVKYQVDGDVFREITEKWPFAYVSEFLIRSRRLFTDRSGNKIESFQISDGRIFTRRVVGMQSLDGNNGTRVALPLSMAAVGEQSITQPR